MDIGFMVCVPFSNRHEDLGCIQFVSSTGHAPSTEEDADLIEIMSMMAAVAIDENEALGEPCQPGRAVMSLGDIPRFNLTDINRL